MNSLIISIKLYRHLFNEYLLNLSTLGSASVFDTTLHGFAWIFLANLFPLFGQSFEAIAIDVVRTNQMQIVYPYQSSGFRYRKQLNEQFANYQRY